MPEQVQDAVPIGRVSFIKSTHAPVHRVYDAAEGDHVPVGNEPDFGKPWRRDPETDSEIHALGGTDHRYNKDLKVGSSYPQTAFIVSDLVDGTPASHDELEAFLKEHDLWSGSLTPIAVPQIGDRGPDFRPHFMYRPPGRAPATFSRIEDRLEGIADEVLSFNANRVDANFYPEE